MDITVSGRHFDPSESLRSRVAFRLDLIAHEYFDHAREANVTFGRGRSFFTCDIDVRAARGLTLRGEGEAADANAAFDDAAEHIAKRLRRYRGRVDEPACDVAATPEAPEFARETVLLEHDPADRAPAHAYATVLAEVRTGIERLTVRQAVLRMDLADHPVLMFRNEASGQLNVVYRRPDGHVCWIDPVAPRG